MPRLLVFAPCEKVIISQDENTPTLISVLTGVVGEYESDGELSPTTHIPMRWAIFSMWGYEDGDETKEFEQIVMMKSPHNTTPLQTSGSSFKIEKEAYHRVTAHLHTMPVGDPGTWTIALYLREIGKELPATPNAEYPFMIKMERKVTNETS